MIRGVTTSLGFVIAITASLAGGQVLAADAAAGEDVFKKKCGTCHDLEKHKTGPYLGGVVGRKAGGTDFKRYKGVAGADFEWTPELLDAYIKDPKAFVKENTDNKRTAMTFKLKDDADRADVIEYLKTTEAPE